MKNTELMALEKGAQVKHKKETLFFRGIEKDESGKPLAKLAKTPTGKTSLKVKAISIQRA